MMGDLVVRSNSKGRGVYAGRRYRKGELICSNPVIVWPHATTPDEFIWCYVWEWQRTVGLAVGLISMMNHDDNPNADTRNLYARRRITCHALRAIQPGEEILIDYGAAASGSFEHR